MIPQKPDGTLPSPHSGGAHRQQLSRTSCTSLSVPDRPARLLQRNGRGHLRGSTPPLQSCERGHQVGVTRCRRKAAAPGQSRCEATDPSRETCSAPAKRTASVTPATLLCAASTFLRLRIESSETFQTSVFLPSGDGSSVLLCPESVTPVRTHACPCRQNGAKCSRSGIRSWRCPLDLDKCDMRSSARPCE